MREMVLNRTGSYMLLSYLPLLVLRHEISFNHPSRNFRNGIFFTLNLLGLERIASVRVAHSFAVWCVLLWTYCWANWHVCAGRAAQQSTFLTHVGVCNEWEGK